MDDILFGLQITAVGMGVVFLLLLVLMVVLMAIGQIDSPRPRLRRGPASQGQPGEAVTAPADGSLEGQDAPAAQLLDAGADPAHAPNGAAPGDQADDPAEAATPAGPTPRVEILHDGLNADQMTAIALAVIKHTQVRRNQAAPAMRVHSPGSLIHSSRWIAVGRSAQNQNWRRR